MSTRNFSAISAKLGGLATALLVTMLLPLSIGSGEGSSGSLVPVRLNDVCAREGVCSPAVGYICYDGETNSSLSNYMCLGCNGGGQTPGTPGGP